MCRNQHREGPRTRCRTALGCPCYPELLGKTGTQYQSLRVHLQSLNVSNVVEAITCRNRTRTDEEGALFVWHGGLIFHDGQASLARGGIEIIHRNFVVTAGEVRVWIYHAEAGAIAPGEVRVDWILSIVRSLVSDGCLYDQTIGGRTVGLHRFVGADEANPKEQARTKIAPTAMK
jgi:hypothetical protein